MDPATWIQPEASFLREARDRLYRLTDTSPAVRIWRLKLFPESAQDVERKIALLLAHGSETVRVFSHAHGAGALKNAKTAARISARRAWFGCAREG